MGDAFSQANATIEAAALGAISITPNNGADLPEKVRAVTIGGNAGVIVYDGWDGVTYTTRALPVGTYPMLAQRIRATGTTATELTGWI